MIPPCLLPSEAISFLKSNITPLSLSTFSSAFVISSMFSLMRSSEKAAPLANPNPPGAKAPVAKELNPNLRTVIRAFDTSFSEKVTELFDIDAAISTSAIVAPAFVATSFEDGIIQTLKSKKGGTKMHLMEIKFVHGELPTTVQFLEKTFDITILAINKQAHPELSDKVKEEDKLLVLGEIDELRRIKRDYC